MKNAIEFLKELKKKPYGNAVFFFGFYLIFFIVIFIILSVGGNDTKKNKNNSDDKYFENYNYSFEYKVVLDNNTYTYLGSKENSIIKYKYNDKEYYNELGKSYIKEDEWKEIDNPIKYNKLLDENIIENIMDSSYIESQTTYNSGDIIYNLLISINTLNKLLEGKDTDYDEVPNKIKITMKDKHISEISYDLDNYCKSNKVCNSLKITINYSEYSPKS